MVVVGARVVGLTAVREPSRRGARVVVVHRELLSALEPDRFTHAGAAREPQVV